MVDVRPDVRWRGSDVGLPEDSPGLLIDTSRLVRSGLLGNLGTTLLGFDPRAIAGRRVLSLQDPVRDVIDPAATLNATVGNPFGFVDRQASGADPVPRVGEGLPSSDVSGGDAVYKRPMGAPSVRVTVPLSPSSPPLSQLPLFIGAQRDRFASGAMPLPFPGPAESAEGQRRGATPIGPTASLLPVSSDERPASDGLQSASSPAANPNIVRVSNGGQSAISGDPQVAQQELAPQELPMTPSGSGNPRAPSQPPAGRPTLNKDPTPGAVAVLPDGKTIPDFYSPTGQVMSPVNDLETVATKGRQAGAAYRVMLANPKTRFEARAYLGAQLGLNVGQGGIHDHQRRGNMITGYTHLQQFRPIANINVGLFGQQAGLSLEDALEIAGTYAKWQSDNADASKPYGLSDLTRHYIEVGYDIGRSGVFNPRDRSNR